MKENKRIKLMQITHDLAIGGLQQVIVNICRTIDRDRFDISVLCLRNTGEFVPEIEEMGIKVFCLPQKTKGTDYFTFLKVAKILRQEKTEVIHTHNTQPFIDGTIGALMSGVKTIIHTDHARQYPDKKRYMFAEHLMSYFAYKVIGVSENTSQNLKRYLKISPDKIITIENGIDESKYNIQINMAQKRKELGIKNNGPIIGLATRLVEQKGVTFLLKAMPEVIKQHSDVTLIIAGQGQAENELKAEISQLNIGKHVLFAGPRLDMPELLNLFDILVLPSLWEGLPMIILEAMAAGCPVIASDIGGLSTAILNGENGYLVEPRNPEVLAQKVIAVLSDDHLRKKLSEKGYQMFREKFSAKKMTMKYESLYQRITQ